MVHCSLTENEHQNFQKMIDNNTHARLTAFQKFRYVASFFWAILLLFAQELFEVKIPSIVFATLISLPLWVLNKEKLPKYLCFLVPITFGVHGVLYLYIFQVMNYGKNMIFRAMYLSNMQDMPVLRQCI